MNGALIQPEKIYFDMDGVLADFDRGIRELCGIEPMDQMKATEEKSNDEMVDTAILGAYGCGVFGNDPETVARLFKEEFEKAGIRNVIYAIPGGRNLIK